MTHPFPSTYINANIVIWFHKFDDEIDWTGQVYRFQQVGFEGIGLGGKDDMIEGAFDEGEQYYEFVWIGCWETIIGYYEQFVAKENVFYS